MTNPIDDCAPVREHGADDGRSPPSCSIPFPCRPFEIRLLLLFRQQWGRKFEVDTDAMTIQEVRRGKKVSFGTAEEKVEFARQLGSV